MPQQLKKNHSSMSYIQQVEDAAGHPAFLPGLEATQSADARVPPYQMVSAAAKREWLSEEDGWQKVARRQPRKSRNLSSAGGGSHFY